MLMEEFYYDRSFIVLAGHCGRAVKEAGWWEDGSEDVQETSGNRSFIVLAGHCGRQ